MTTTTSYLRLSKTGPNIRPSERGFLPVFLLGLLAGLSLLAAVLVPIKRMLRRRRRRRAADDRANHHHHHHEEDPGERTSLLSTPTILSATTSSAGTDHFSSSSSSSVPTNTTNLRTVEDDGPGEHDGLLASTDRPY